MSDAASIDAALDAAAAVLGGSIQAFVNNAGYSGSFQARVLAGWLAGWLVCGCALKANWGHSTGT